jgi:hypothetical protein
MATPVVEFSSEGYKISKFLAQNQPTQRKLLNFENWSNGELSKLGIILENKVIFKTDYIKKLMKMKKKEKSERN